MGEHSEEWQRGYRACLTGGTLTLGLDPRCASMDFADGYLAAMEGYMRWCVSFDSER
jgi:hypothetical protein